MSRGLQTEPGFKKKKKKGVCMKNIRRHVKFTNLQYDENCAFIVLQLQLVKLVLSSSLELLV